MCLSVEVADLGPLAVILDLPGGLIAVHDGMTPEEAVNAMRDVLRSAGIAQPVPDRAMCHCGIFLRETVAPPLLCPA